MDLKNFYKQYIKRVMDILCSFLFLVLFWWLLVLVAFLVKIRLGSPILFTQDRPGKKGKVFKLYKFRSMIDKCDKEGNPLPDDERLQQDVYYVDHCSLFLDCKIILRTVLKVVKRSDVLVGKQIPAGRLDVSRKNRLDLNGVK